MGLFTSVLFAATLVSLNSCAEKPVATGYKNKISENTANSTIVGATGNPGGKTPAAGDAAKGATTLTASCETAGCHAKVGGGAHALVIADVAKIDTTAPNVGAHGGVKALFTSDGANMKAALTARAGGGGDAVKGAATLTASCETAGCHAKVGGGAHVLIKGDAAKIDTTAPNVGSHAGVKALFTSDGANMKAALNAL